MKEIKRWFQGGNHCPGVAIKHAYLEPGEEKQTDCLITATDTREERVVLWNIITRLFPERTCSCSSTLVTLGEPSVPLMHFNNHPDTTRDQIDKIIHEFNMEVGQ